jgi:hypothetical protein
MQGVSLRTGRDRRQNSCLLRTHHVVYRSFRNDGQQALIMLQYISFAFLVKRALGVVWEILFEDQ